VEVRYRQAESVTYVVPLATRREPQEGSPSDEEARAVIARLVGAAEPSQLLDGSQVPGIFETLLGLVIGRREVRADGMALVGRREAPLAARLAREARAQRARAVGEGPFSSNSLVAFGDRMVMKLYRVLEDGPNPDLELGRFLARRGFTRVAAVLGSLELARGTRSSATLALVQAYVPHEGDLWEATRDAVEAFLHDSEAEAEAPELDTGGRGFLLRLARREPPAAATRLMGASMTMAETLGRRLGELHGTLASADSADKALAPEGLTPFYIRSLYQSVRGRVLAAREDLEARLPALASRETAAAEATLAALQRVEPLLAALRDLRPDGQRIRVHGDLHLGHVLDTGSDVVFLDFEGDTGRPLSERRLKRPALVDLASLVRSIHFAAHWPGVARELFEADTAASARRAAWSTFWFQWMSAACVRGYRGATQGAAFLPTDDESWSVLLESLIVARACDELTGRLGRRSDWLGLPLAGLEELLGGTDGHGDAVSRAAD
jgi:trehalose synthase-fused probable maltokinase